MDAATIKRRAMREVGDVGRDTVWEVTLPISTESGTWTLSFGGRTTGAIVALADRGVVQSALESLLGVGNVEVIGIPLGPFLIKLTGSFGAQCLPETSYPFLANGSGLQPAATLTPIQKDEGESQVLTSVANEIYIDLAAIPNPETRRVKLKIALLETLLGGSHSAIDIETAQRVEKFAQQHDNLLELLDRAKADLREILNSGATSARAGGSTSGKIRKQTPNGRAYGQLSRDRHTGRFS
ncbi:hypothetical protein EON80_08665 [bacterium]|nr:MAG: hypothetical protein EON80_08665 [bacterium]